MVWGRCEQLFIHSHIILTLDSFDLLHYGCHLRHVHHITLMISLRIFVECIIVRHERLQKLTQQTLHQSCTLEMLLTLNPEGFNSRILYDNNKTSYSMKD